MLRVSDYAGRPRDSRVENELAARLRAMTAAEAYAFICEYLDHDPIVALHLARRGLRERRHFEQILARGFETADASSIRYWLEACLDKLGPKRVVKMFEQLAATNPRAAARTLYWTRIYVLRADPAMRERLDALASQLEPPR